MEPSTRIQILAQVPFFHGLSAAELEAAAAAAHTQSLERGAFFFQQGDPAEALFLLSQGRLKLAQVTADGDEVLLRFVSPGQMFGGVAAFGEVTYPVSAQTVEDCVALRWSGQVMSRLMERYPRIALNALHMVVERHRELQDRFRELSAERVERRVARALLRLARQVGTKTEDGVLIDLPLSRQDLASMTGTTLYTVSRLLSHWQEKGLVEAGRERVLIRFPHGLVAIAEDLPVPNE